MRSDFTERDNKLKIFRTFDKVLLWFEHDLYDQFQILQILDWFNQQNLSEITLAIICTDQYLSMQTPQQLKKFSHKKPLLPPDNAHLQVKRGKRLHSQHLKLGLSY